LADDPDEGAGAAVAFWDTAMGGFCAFWTGALIRKLVARWWRLEIVAACGAVKGGDEVAERRQVWQAKRRWIS
jgi:hypothetical protein